MKIPSLFGIVSTFILMTWLLETKKQSEENFIGENSTVWQIVQNSANIFLVKTCDRYLLIDSGIPGKAKKLVAEIEKIGISPSKIDYLILSHAHPDHAGNAKYFQEKFGIEIIAGSGEEEMINKKGEDTNLCPTGFLGEIIQRTVARKRYDTFIPDIVISEKFDLSEIGFQGTILPMSGHTEGSLVISIRTAVFVGDVIRGKALQSKKPTRHVFVCDYDKNLKNIETISKIEGVQTWFPGHGGPLVQEDVLKFISKEKLK